jgi:transposase
MEATGQYWKPVWQVLEERGFQLMLVNARQVKILPGRKTDVADAAWLAELLEHGLLRGSFGDHHALLVHLALGHLEQLEETIAALDRRVEEVIAPFAGGP